MPRPHSTADISRLRAAAVRLGHGLMWVLIAGVFSVVEGAVLLTEHIPGRRARRPSETATSDRNAYAG